MKVIYISLFAVLGLLFLSECTEPKVVNDTKQSVKTEEKVKSDHVNVKENEIYTVPFKIREINSDFASLNDSAFDKPLSGVRYEVSLFSEKELTNEDRLSFKFDVVTDSSLLKESLGSIQPLTLTDTRDGYLYTLVFETMYRNYSEEELETLNKERNFHIFLDYDGLIKKVEFI